VTGQAVALETEQPLSIPTFSISLSTGKEVLAEEWEASAEALEALVEVSAAWAEWAQILDQPAQITNNQISEVEGTVLDLICSVSFLKSV